MKKICTSFSKSLMSSSFLKIFQQTRMPYYAVAAGWEPGIYETWAVCEMKVKGYSKPIYKKFKSLQEADAFLKSNGVKIDSAASSYNPRSVAIPLTPKKTSSELIDQGLSAKLIAAPTTKFSKRLESEYQPPIIKELEQWPDDVECEDDDDDFLLAAAAEVEGIPENPLKRKILAEAEVPGGSKASKKYTHESKIWEPIGLKQIGKFEFPIDSEGFVIVYTDGSCINNGQANASAGFGVYFSKGHPLNAAKPVDGRVTNNAGEIQAAIYAIKTAKDFGIRKLCLSTDSQFLINAVTSWIKVWKRKGWKLKSGAPVKNKDDFVILDEILDGSIEIKWNYVKGHKGIIGNEMADQLARRGSDLYKEMMTK